MVLKNHILVALLSLVTAGQCILANSGPELQALYPLGERGLFTPGAEVSIRVKGNNPEQKEESLSWNWVVKNYNDQVIQKGTAKATLANGDFAADIPLQAISQQGFFMIDLTLSSGDKQLAELSSSFCILPKSVPRDRFLFSNGNGNDRDLVPAMKWMGIHGKSLPFQIHSVPVEMRGKWAEFIEHERKEGRHAPFMNGEVALAGQFSIQHMPVWLKEEVARKKERREQPYSEEFYEEYGDFVEASAEAYKGVIRDWIISEEVDITCSQAADTVLAGFELERYIRMSQIVHDRVKKVIPDARIIALTLSSDAELTQTPRLRWTRRNLLSRLKGSFDIIGPDVYAGPWLITRNNANLTGPEHWKFREILLDLVDFQRQLNTGEEEIIIGEKGVMIPYHLPPNDDLEKLMANQTARNIIIARSVKEVAMYQHYLVGSGAGYRADVLKVNETKGQALADEAAWKSGYHHGKPYYRPRSVVASINTVEGLLAGTRGGTELTMPKGVYAYLFDKSDGTQIAAVWTPDKTPIGMQLPPLEGGRVIDLMGNAKALETSGSVLPINESPLFVELKGDHQTARKVLESARFPSHESLDVDVTLACTSEVAIHLRNRSAKETQAIVHLQPSGGNEWKSERKEVTIKPLSGATVVFEWKNPLSFKGDLSRQIMGSIEVEGKQTAFSKALDCLAIFKKSDKPTFVLRGGGALFPSSDVTISGAWHGVDDLDGTITLTWDDAYLHIKADVKDDIHIQRYSDGNIWKDDSIQFAISASSASPVVRDKEGFAEGDSVFGLALHEGQAVLHCWVNNGVWSSGRETSPSFPHRVVRTGQITQYEVSIPWSSLPQCKPKAGQALAFNLVIFDKDDAALSICDYWMALSDGLAGGADSSRFRRFVLFDQ